MVCCVLKRNWNRGRERSFIEPHILLLTISREDTHLVLLRGTAWMDSGGSNGLGWNVNKIIHGINKNVCLGVGHGSSTLLSPLSKWKPVSLFQGSEMKGCCACREGREEMVTLDDAEGRPFLLWSRHAIDVNATLLLHYETFFCPLPLHLLYLLFRSITITANNPNMSVGSIRFVILWCTKTDSHLRIWEKLFLSNCHGPLPLLHQQPGHCACVRKTYLVAINLIYLTCNPTHHQDGNKIGMAVTSGEIPGAPLPWWWESLKSVIE